MKAVVDKFHAELEFIDCMSTIFEIFRGRNLTSMYQVF